MKKISLLALSLMIFLGCAVDNPPIKSNPKLPKVQQFKAYPDRNAIALFWKSIPNMKGYFIQMFNFKSKKWGKTIEIDNPYRTTYMVRNLKPNTIYRFKIATFDAKKIPSLAIQIDTKTLPTVAPVVPLEGRPLVKGMVKIIFRPHQNERVNRYIIEKYDNKTTKWHQIAELNGRFNVEYIDNKNLKDGEIYKYRVIAETFDNLKSVPSTPITISTYPKPPLVENIEATNNLPKKIIVTWSPVENAKSYKIYISDSLNNFFDFYKEVQGTKFEDVINKDGWTRYYKVTAVSPHKTESILGNTQAVMGQTLNVPPTPIVATNRNNTKLTLTIRPQDNRSKYFLIKVKENVSMFENKNRVYKTPKNTFSIKINPKYSYEIEVFEVDKYGLTSKPNVIEVEN